MQGKWLLAIVLALTLPGCGGTRVVQELDAPIDGKDFEFDLPVTSDPMYVLVTNDGYDSAGTTIVQTSAVVTPTVLVDINWRFRFSPISRAEAQRLVEEFGREWK